MKQRWKFDPAKSRTIYKSKKQILLRLEAQVDVLQERFKETGNVKTYLAIQKRIQLIEELKIHIGNFNAKKYAQDHEEINYGQYLGNKIYD